VAFYGQVLYNYLMNLSLFDGVLLFALAIPLVMKYRILPIEGTPYWLFGIFFSLSLFNIFVSYVYKTQTDRRFTVFKTVITWVLLAIVLGGSIGTAIVDRGKIAPGLNYQTHDIILQLESAIHYLGEHKNPYKETYFGTPLETWHYAELDKDAVNPALYHFVMPPWYLLFSYPFYFISHRMVGYFDGRMPLLFCMICLLITISLWFKNKPLGRIAVIITALSPATVDYFIEGRSDIFALFWLVLAIFLLEKRWYIWSAVIFALAILSKQTVWFAFPLYVLLLWMKAGRSNKQVLPAFAVMTSLIVVLSAPFILWDAHAFFNSIIFYLSGGPGGYPVSGYGLGMLLYEFGVIKDIHASYPFILWQLGFGIPALIGAFYWLRKKPTTHLFFIVYGIVLCGIWYVSRYFNNSHVAFVSSLLVLGALLEFDQHEKRLV
jgi:hypothetical protein